MAKRRRLRREARNNLRTAVDVLNDGRQTRSVLAALRFIRTNEAAQDEFAAELQSRFSVDPANRGKLFRLFVEHAPEIIRLILEILKAFK